MPATPQDRLRAKQPRRITVGVFLDESLADRLDAAVLAVQDARRVTAPAEDIDALEAAVKAAQEALDAETMWFTFQGLGRLAFARLLAEYPPPGDQTADAKQAGRDAPEYDLERFPAALLAASCAAPALTIADFEGLYSDPAWNADELGSLFAAALSVNVRARPLQVRAQP
jgi:hypothetical protein